MLSIKNKNLIFILKKAREKSVNEKKTKKHKELPTKNETKTQLCGNYSVYFLLFTTL